MMRDLDALVEPSLRESVEHDGRRIPCPSAGITFPILLFSSRRAVGTMVTVPHEGRAECAVHDIRLLD